MSRESAGVVISDTAVAWSEALGVLMDGQGQHHRDRRDFWKTPQQQCTGFTKAN